MNVPLFIAWRYLFARKKHNVINIISMISAIGICIGTMALVVILSVYNGFDGIIQKFYTEHKASFVVQARKGTSFELEPWQVMQLRLLKDQFSTGDSDVYVAKVVSQTVFLQYNGRQKIATAVGIDTLYGRKASLVSAILQGSFSTRFGEVPMAVFTKSLASTLGVNPAFMNPVEIYFPSRTSTISLINPYSSLNSAKVFPQGVIQDISGYDTNLMYVDVPLLQELIEYDNNDFSSVEVYAGNNRFLPEIEKKLKGIFKHEDFSVKDIYQQNEVIFKMVNMEKAMVYLILFFVIFIVAINIFSSLSMLVLEKRDEMLTFHSMGMQDSMIKRIFSLQGALISLLGAVTGIILGLALCVLQIKTHFIALPGNYLTTWYPVDIHATDILIVFAGVAAMGYLIASCINIKADTH